MNVEFMIPRIEVNKRKRRKAVMRPFVKRKEQTPVLGIVDVITMCCRKELRRHPFDLRREDVSHIVAERLEMIPFAAKAEQRRETDLRQDLGILGDKFRKDVILALNRYDMGQSDDPDLGLISSLLDSFHPIDMEKLGVNRTLI